MRSLLVGMVFLASVATLALQGCGGGGGGGPDGGGPDGGQPDASIACTSIVAGDVASWNGVAPATLTATGLYQCSGGTLALADDVHRFQPTYALWSDDAVKTRWVKLPPNGVIDTSDMDHWSFPVGTRFWKEFVVDGKRLETRMIARFDAGTNDFIFATYQWNQAQTEATYATDGITNANGTTHDIPSPSQCTFCHGWLPEHILGFSAIQLTHTGAPGDEDLFTLAAEGKLSAAPADGGYPVPGDAVTQAALGYMHGNCGNCHNSTGIVFNQPMRLRLLVGQRTPQTTDPYLTAVGVPVEHYLRPNVVDRVVPGNPDASCISVRMSQRAPGEQMPPVATKDVDDAGLAAVNAWIRSLP